MRYIEEENVSSNDSDLLDIYGIAEVNATSTMEAVEALERPILRALLVMYDAVEALERPILRALLVMYDAIYREAWK